MSKIEIDLLCLGRKFSFKKPKIVFLASWGLFANPLDLLQFALLLLLCATKCHLQWMASCN